jgi:hypothetical protein
MTGSKPTSDKTQSLAQTAPDKFCQNCGKGMAAGDVFCGFCGARAEVQPVQQPQPVPVQPMPMQQQPMPVQAQPPVQEQPQPVQQPIPVPVQLQPIQQQPQAPLQPVQTQPPMQEQPLQTAPPQLVSPQPQAAQVPPLQQTVLVPEPAPTSSLPPEPLKAAVQAVASQVQPDGKTVAFYDLAGAEPVVGWLVFTAGEYQGESFSLQAGRNTIGRAQDMDIALLQESSVSRNKHAIVTYEPQKRVFLIQPGEGSGLTYVNGELIMTFQELHDYDKVTLGKAECRLRTFCNENFSWDSENEV